MLVEKARFSARSDSDDSDDEKKDEEEDPQKVIADLESKDGFEKENDLVTFFKYKVFWFIFTIGFTTTAFSSGL